MGGTEAKCRPIDFKTLKAHCQGESAAPTYERMTPNSWRNDMKIYGRGLRYALINPSLLDGRNADRSILKHQKLTAQ
ncbi:hypothetical protein Taro_029429, partial [Colocasia esculenta]|nr:hypothetical protein [Colocasia esculenta]